MAGGKQRRVSRAERRDLLRKAGRIVLAVVPLIDGATPEELANAAEVVEDFYTSFRSALATTEPVEDEPAEDRP